MVSLCFFVGFSGFALPSWFLWEGIISLIMLKVILELDVCGIIASYFCLLLTFSIILWHCFCIFESYGVSELCFFFLIGLLLVNDVLINFFTQSYGRSCYSVKS